MKFRQSLVLSAVLLVIISRFTQVSHSAAGNITFDGLDALRLDPAGRRIIHVSKECSPVTTFGGVGQMLGELTVAQSKLTDTSVAVVMPKYGSIDHVVYLWTTYSFHFGNKLVTGDVYKHQAGKVTFILIGTPSIYPLLWTSQRVEDAYNCPSGTHPQDRDLLFSFVAASLIKSILPAEKERAHFGKFIVHAHGATNVPVLWFLKSLALPFGSLIYSIHDYDSEVKVLYSMKKISAYSNLSPCKTSLRAKEEQSPVVFACHGSSQAETISPTVETCGHSSQRRVPAAYFSSCADVITSVSSGMIKELMLADPHTAELLLHRSAAGMLFPIRNWVSQSLWEEARALVPYVDPLDGKRKAKGMLLDYMQEYGYGDMRGREISCAVGWFGRYEKNKGLHLLPSIFEAACKAGCFSVFSGYSTSVKMDKARARTTLTLHRISKANNGCPFLMFPSKADQKDKVNVVRAAIDITIIPSLKEGFGLVAAEALAFGSIPVVSSVGGLPEIISPYTGQDDSLDSWTGIEFPLFTTSQKLTSISASTATSRAVRLLQSHSGNRRPLLQRLIRSTPLRDGKHNVSGVYAYNRAYDLVHNWAAD